MNILFFQNCISPHQMPYINQLPLFSEVDNVIVVVPEVDMVSRKMMGWNASGLMNVSNVKFLIAPTIEDVKRLYSKYTGHDTWCMYSGISSFVAVKLWFRMSLKYKVRRGIITEPPIINKRKPLWLHYVRFCIQDRKFIPYIDKVFAFGPLAISYYNSWSSRWKVIPFAYCTALKCTQIEVVGNNDINLVFVGSLIKRKNVKAILFSMSLLPSNIKLHILGDGPESADLRRIADYCGIREKVFFHGKREMNEVYSILPNYDILILPSYHDGWGAVVNEALQSGLYVICSDKCGSQMLLTDPMLGRVFKSQSELSCILKECVMNIEEIRRYRKKRLVWSENISGEKIAKYFVANLVGDELVAEPWKEKL